MSIFSRAYNRLMKRDLSTDLLTWMGLPYGFGSTSLSKMQAMQLSAVYRCVDVLGDALATPTIELQQRKGGEGWISNPDDPLHHLWNLEPNPTMSAYTMRKLANSKVYLEGNAYIRIYRDYMGYPIQLRLVLDQVKIVQDDTGILYYFIQSDPIQIVEQSDIIHLKNYSYDGLIGVSTLTHASNTLTTYDASERHAKGWFYGGGTGAAIVKVAGRLNKKQAMELKEDFIQAMSPADGSPNSVVVLDANKEVQQFPAIPPRDAQLLETREFEMTDICRFFGVDPTKIFHTKDSKYNTVESMQLAFLTDTISPRFNQHETEFNRKLFLPSLRSTLRVRYDAEDLLRTDLDSKANYRMKMFQVGGYTVDDNRQATNKPKFNTPESSTAWVQVNMQPLNNLKDNGTGTKKFDE